MSLMPHVLEAFAFYGLHPGESAMENDSKWLDALSDSQFNTRYCPFIRNRIQDGVSLSWGLLYNSVRGI